VSHEHVLEMPPPWSIVRNNRPPTLPAKVTTPSSGATTTVPIAAAMSMPRWPAPYGSSGGSKPRTIAPVTGHVHGTAARAPADGNHATAKMTSREQIRRTEATLPAPLLRIRDGCHAAALLVVLGHLATQHTDGFGVDLADARLRHAEDVADLREGEPFEVVQRDDDLLAL
jgi:hypothetical protein